MQRFNYLLVALTVTIVGCRSESEVASVNFEPNLVYAYQIGQNSEQSMDQAITECELALTELFGTPDEPKLPEFIAEDEMLASLLSMDKLIAASGSADETGRGLYRKHCANCHGVTGDGRGPMAALINPYPRDYRLGKFKFKSTAIGTKPTKEDINYLIKHGIQGSQMIAIPELTDEDIEALTDYVIYLSWRGEVERSLYRECLDLFFSDGDSLYNPALKDSEDEDDQLMYEDQIYLLEDTVIRIAENWSDAQEEALKLPERDPALVPDSVEEIRLALNDSDSAIAASVSRGKILFASEKTACAKCHGKDGKGDGQTNDYDEWSKDWIKGIKPEDEEAQIPLIARGALPLRNVSPRNFHEGVFRGGKTPEHLYQRIALGIEGTPMPAAAVEPEQIWDLVNYVRSLEDPKPDESESADTSSDASTAEKGSLTQARSKELGRQG